MDKASNTNGYVPSGISIRNGPVDEMDLEGSHANGVVNGVANGKRKSRASLSKQNYAEASDSEEDDEPIVCTSEHAFLLAFLMIPR